MKYEIFMSVYVMMLVFGTIQPQILAESKPETVSYQNHTYPVYPKTCQTRPDIPSPYITPDKQHLITALQKDGQFVIVPVTPTNTIPPIPFTGRRVGLAEQLIVDSKDFPTLAKTGLHAESELDRTRTITGKSVELITERGRPKADSNIGFMADDEDILSVLKGDNRLVRRLGLTHPQLAEPLFCLMNLILKQIETGKGRPWDDLQYVLYNDQTIGFVWVQQAKRVQQSLFNDQIIGSMDVHLYRDLSDKEKAFLRKKYPDLDGQQWAELVAKLTHLRTGEMQPYFIMRYGFYEGHTEYRVDPIAIAFVFGLCPLEDIEAAFPGKLHETLMTHFNPSNLPAALRLSPAEALKIADAFAARKRAEYETFDLALYPDRKAKCDPEGKKWFIHYMRQPNRWPGDHFSVLVDDQTGECQYRGGA